ncbi:hypothetical protein BABINDRAFT_164209 [Babjeviella inositovora NRRL Y-12698]|uniref:RNA polymerase Rpb4/RPC9 core domain-containing protein n=1 Tax=Babjeviella inositovora NRRL Y-12698 TaxID=984486 RepID=A0A1E3QXX0_9ASCO|nr:uncharacterized protein BABINDRAFT_164209 [Babjeviella inositovora NRRL Y-12698]ODQ82414.1 hypothetical protein BABINDRAFT_164209 [Babjeviella inositovora NRRL Y-12698]
MNISTSTLGTRRRKGASNNTQDLEENALVLKLGPEFSLKQISHLGHEVPLTALNLSEAKILIREALKGRRSANGGHSDDEDEMEKKDLKEDDIITNSANANEILRKTINYINNFARFKDDSSIAAVEELLREYNDVDGNKQEFHPFEKAQLGSLMCDDADEAKTLIPSLQDKISDPELQSILNQLRRHEAPY